MRVFLCICTNKQMIFIDHQQQKQFIGLSKYNLNKGSSF